MGLMQTQFVMVCSLLVQTIHPTKPASVLAATRNCAYAPVASAVADLQRNGLHPIRIGREALRCLLLRRGVTFQRTKTWKESTDPDFDAKLDRIEYAINERPDRTFAFDKSGPLGIRPTAGACWAREGRTNRLPATFHPRDHLALGSPEQGRAVLHADERVWANPIEAHFGPLQQFALATPTTPTTPFRPAPCTPTCAGATRTPDTPTSWPRNVANAPASTVRGVSAGETDPSLQWPDQHRIAKRPPCGRLRCYCRPGR
jgi:hypothetical protein